MSVFMVVLSRSIDVWAFSKLRKMITVFFSLYKFQMPQQDRPAVKAVPSCTLAAVLLSQHIGWCKGL